MVIGNHTKIKNKSLKSFNDIIISVLKVIVSWMSQLFMSTKKHLASAAASQLCL